MKWNCTRMQVLRGSYCSSGYKVMMNVPISAVHRIWSVLAANSWCTTLTIKHFAPVGYATKIRAKRHWTKCTGSRNKSSHHIAVLTAWSWKMVYRASTQTPRGMHVKSGSNMPRYGCNEAQNSVKLVLYAVASGVVSCWWRNTSDWKGWQDCVLSSKNS